MERPRKPERSRKIRIAPDNPVRRRLFPDDPDDVTANSRNENFNNAVKEKFERETTEMSKKYNYDFKNDLPHPYVDGTYDWCQNVDGIWVGVEKPRENTPKEPMLTEKDLNIDLNIESDNLKRKNETTPKSFSQGDLPKIKKKKVEENTHTSMKRRLTF